MLVDLVKKIPNSKLQEMALVLILVLVSSPMVVMILNALPIETDYVFYVWATIPYLVGDIGWLLGLLFLVRLISSCNYSFVKKIQIFLPLILLAIFAIWCFICDYNSEFRFVALTCYLSMQDGFFMYFAYGGIILLGLLLSSDKKKLSVLANVFLAVSAVMAIIVLLNNDLTELLCRTEYTNSVGYESVFFNSNHYGYYLVFNVLISAFMFANIKEGKFKFLYLALYALFTVTLVFNNTFGSYLAIFLTLIFAVVWINLWLLLIMFLGYILSLVLCFSFLTKSYLLLC